jgi:hypothetical protein
MAGSADPIRAIADAVLYEGYILWPYRRSALKNQQRFNFGGVYPPAHSAEHPDDPDRMQTQVLLQGDRATAVEVTVRFLHVVQRAVRDAGGALIDELVVDDERHLAWEEAVEREVVAPRLSVPELAAAGAFELPISISAGTDSEAITDRAGRRAGTLVRSWQGLDGRVSLSAEPAGGAQPLWRVTVSIVNLTLLRPGSARPAALRRALCSTHTLLHAERGAFVSLTDPPAEHAGTAAACRNIGTWPVLVGERGDRSTMLSSPIILEDHPRIAPESPGDLFDGGEIDQLLVLNILALSDEEKAEMRASDPRGREILERTEALTPAQLMALHGTVREFGMAR